ncbi:hypothetical protein [Candidatus Bandiella euplotis]|nr:hypothetical protein [Candidatus Bandiella woodruffii]
MTTLSKVAHDKQAKIGCKGGSKFWYGYKKTCKRRYSIRNDQQGCYNAC